MTGQHPSLALGGAALSRLPERQLAATVATYAEMDGRLFDVSPAYGGWDGVDRVAAAIRQWVPDPAVIIKLGYFDDPDKYRCRSAIRDQCHRLIERTKINPCVIMLHEADWAAWWRLAAIGELLSDGETGLDPGGAYYLRELSQEIGCASGLAGNHANALSRATEMMPELDAVLLAKQVDLLWGTGDAMAASLASADTAVILAAPFHQGWIFRLGELARARPEMCPAIERLAALQEAEGTEACDWAIPFLRVHMPGCSVMVGATTPDEVRDAFAAFKRELCPELYASIAANRICASAMQGLPLKRARHGLLALEWGTEEDERNSVAE